MIVLKIKTDKNEFLEIGSDVYRVEKNNLYLVDSIEGNIIDRQNIIIGIHNYRVDMFGPYLDTVLKHTEDVENISIGGTIYQVPNIIFETFPDINLYLGNYIYTNNKEIINFDVTKHQVINLENYFYKENGVVKQLKGVRQ